MLNTPWKSVLSKDSELRSEGLMLTVWVEKSSVMQKFWNSPRAGENTSWLRDYKKHICCHSHASVTSDIPGRDLIRDIMKQKNVTIGIVCDLSRPRLH